MNNEDQFPTEKLIQNTIAAFKNGYIQEDAALSTIDFAAKLGDRNAQTILEQSKQTSFAQAVESLGK